MSVSKEGCVWLILWFALVLLIVPVIPIIGRNNPFTLTIGVVWVIASAILAVIITYLLFNWGSIRGNIDGVYICPVCKIQLNIGQTSCPNCGREI